MKIFADYHTHTIYSHGKGTIRENVEAAIKKGLKEIVISDHGPAHVFYGVRKNKLKKMREEIDKLKSEYPQIKIMLGIEANVVSCDGDLDVDSEDIKIIDKLLAGFHNGAMPKDFKSFCNLIIKNKLSKIIPSLKKECRRINTEALIKAINKYNIDIITHPGAKVDIDTRLLARAAAKKGTILEINSSHGYMTSEYVKIAMEEGAYFAIDSDAHRPKDVGNFVKGIEIAKKAGISEDRIVNAKMD